LDELPAIYGTNTLDPPAAHVAAAILAGAYALVVLGFALAWLGAIRAAARARRGRRSVLEAGPIQLVGRIAGEGRVIRGPANSERVVETTIEPFALQTGVGPVRVTPSRRVRFHGSGTSGAPLEAGQFVEVVGRLTREKQATTEGYRGEATEGWVVVEPPGGPVRLWRHSRSAWPERRRSAAIGGLLAALVFAMLSALSLTGYLVRLTLGETIEATLITAGPAEDGFEAVIDRDHGDRVHEVVPAEELEGWTADSPIAYRAVPALPFFGAVGPGAAIPGSALFFAILFLVCCLAGTVAQAAVLLEGD